MAVARRDRRLAKPEGAPVPPQRPSNFLSMTRNQVLDVVDRLTAQDPSKGIAPHEVAHSGGCSRDDLQVAGVIRNLLDSNLLESPHPVWTKYERPDGLPLLVRLTEEGRTLLG